MSAQLLRVAGLAATALVGAVALAPAAGATPAKAKACTPSTSPLVTCGPQVNAPAGVISLGQPMTMGASNQKTGTTTTFLVHHNAQKKAKVPGSGSVGYSWTPTKTGTYATSISGTQLTGASQAHIAGVALAKGGKGYGKTYITKVKPAHSKGHAVLPNLNAQAAAGTNLALAAAQQTPAVAVTKSAYAAPATGVSLDAHDGLVTALAGAGLMAGLAGSTYVGRRRRATV